MEHIIEKVRKLRALSTSNNIHESHTAAALANKLIVKYQLRESDLIEQKVSDPNRTEEYYPEPLCDDPEPMYETARVIAWKQQLASVLAHHYGCAIWNDVIRKGSKGGRSISRYRLIGRKDDVALCKMMFKWLVQEIERHCEIECRGLGSGYTNSFYKGAVKAIHSVLQESRERVLEEAKASGHSAAIQRLQNRESEAINFMYRKYHLIQAAPKSQFNSEAFERGFDVANHVSRRMPASGE